MYLSAIVVAAAAGTWVLWVLLCPEVTVTRLAAVGLAWVAWAFLVVVAAAAHYGNSPTASECAKAQPSSSLVIPMPHSPNSAKSIVFVKPLAVGVLVNRAP